MLPVSRYYKRGWKMSRRLIAVIVASVSILPLVPALEYVSVGGQDIQPFRAISFRRYPRQTTNILHDNHIYYTSTFYPAGPQASSLWLELNDLEGSGVTEDTDFKESLLSGLHRHFENHRLKFTFPFYGHILTNLAVTTGGFLYTGDQQFRLIYYYQFIAPLLADFNPSLNSNGRILVLNSEERFTVQWDNVYNYDHFNDGPFTFQVSLFPNGEIHFVYKQIPLRVNEINNDDHPVEVGLADAFYVESTLIGGLTFMRIVEYHRVQLLQSLLSNTAFILKPLPNCISITSCQECVNLTKKSSFKCAWCNNLNRCSDGIDRYRQEWIGSGCFRDGTTNCKHAPSSMPTPTPTPTPTPMPTTSGSLEMSNSTLNSAVLAISVALILLVILASLVLVLTVLCYGYRRPNTKLGLLMIKYRPMVLFKAISKGKSIGVLYNVKTGTTTLVNEQVPS